MFRISTLVIAISALPMTIVKLAAKEPAAVTYANSVAKILYDNCASCHRPGQSGPFALLTFDDASQHAETIKAVIDSGYMPPWKPLHEGIDFAGTRRLSEADKQKLLDWISADCPEGNRQEIPPAPKFPAGWALGKPDLIVKLDKPFAVPASGRDVYRSFIFPVDLPEDKWIKAIEFKPTARGAVHHALFFIDDAGSSKRAPERDGQPGFKGMSFVGGSPSDLLTKTPDRMASGLGGYVPGATPNKLPGDLARLLPKHSNVVMQTHFHPTGKAEIEQGELALYFTNTPPKHRLQGVQLPAIFGVGAGINVPAGEKNYRVTDSYTLPIDVQAHEIAGHAHYICREMEMTAKLPDGQQLTLLKIDDWDLDWQDQYAFAKPIDLPKGTLVTATIVYDNSADNPENPYSPPQTIGWGRESNDEMGAVTLTVTAKDEQELPQLADEMRQRGRDALRKRVSSQAGVLNMLPSGGRGGALGNLVGGGIVRLWDRNRDGKLQDNELPERGRDRLLEFMDKNRDGEIDANEIEEGRKMLKRFSEEK